MPNGTQLDLQVK